MPKLNGLTIPAFMVVFLIVSFISYGKLGGAVENNADDIKENSNKIEQLACLKQDIAVLKSQMCIQGENTKEIQADLKVILRKMQ